MAFHLSVDRLLILFIYAVAGAPISAGPNPVRIYRVADPSSRPRHGRNLERTAGIEPASPAWKAGVIAFIRRPPELSRSVLRCLERLPASVAILVYSFRLMRGGGGWIRTNVGIANGFTARPF